MEAPCCIPALISGHTTKVTSWDGAKLGRLSVSERDDMRKIIDGMGRLSAYAQRLRMPITDYERIYLGSQKMYLLSSCGPTKGTVLVKGLLKVGSKNLFIRRECGALMEINPLCVLDFYIHVSCQRMGLGRQMFEAMLSIEKKLPHQIGYDRPSPKLLSFLAKHYNMKRYYPQANQFVMYNAYFNSPRDDKPETGTRRKPNHNKTNCSNNNNNNVVSFLDTPRVKKDVLHGRRANKSPTEKDDTAPPPPSLQPPPPPSPSIALRRRVLLQDDEVREVPPMSKVFPDQPFSGGESHYDWMTGTRRPLVRPIAMDLLTTRCDGPDGISFSSGLNHESGPASSGSRRGGCFYDPDMQGKAPPESVRIACARSPRSNYRAHLSGTGAAAALGFRQP